MKLTETDLKILKSYDTVLDGLAEYLGDGCEIVLHSLGKLDESVVKIVNGHHTGRKIGAPITNVALEMLAKVEQEPDVTSISYFSKNKNGEPLKSATITIKGENNRIIGLFCINYYLNTPLSQFISVFSYCNESRSQSEVFLDDGHDVLEDAILQAKQIILSDNTILPSLKNRNIINILYKQGVFNIKNAVDIVAVSLNISKNTIYLHLRNIKDNKS